MKWVAFTFLGAAVAVLAVATLASADFAMHLQGTQPTVEALYAERGIIVGGAPRDLVFVARLDGTVQALDRTNEHVVWTSELSSGPGTRALDMVSEPGADNPLYVATSIDGNGKSEPIVAIRKSDGAVLWRSTEAFATVGRTHLVDFDPLARGSDAYRLALDTGRDTPHLWAGLEHGYVLMLNKADGTPVLDAGGNQRALDPTARDRLTPLPPPNAPCLRPSGIYALAVHDGQLWAARNFGGVDKAGNCANPLLTSLFNLIYRLDADQIVDAAGEPVGSDTMPWANEMRADPVDPANCVCPDGRRFASPSILDIWVDPAQSDAAQQTLYMVGAFTGKTGAIIGLRSSGQPGANAPFPLVFAIADTHVDDDSEFGAPPPVAIDTFEMGESSIANSVRGDGQGIYVTTWQNVTTGMPGVEPGGFVVRYGLDLGAPIVWSYDTSDTGTGFNVPTAGRSWEAGDANALYVEPGPEGKVFVGHGNAVPPYPGPGVPHRMGALVVEAPKGLGPVPVLMLPYVGDTLGGQTPIAFRTDNPASDAAAPVDAIVQYTIGMGDTPWTTLANLHLPSAPGNGYSVTNNVPLGQLPERDDIRLRVQVTGRDGRVGSDRTDGPVIVDRTPPAISAYGVGAGTSEVLHGPSGNPVVRTATPTFFVRGLDPCRMPAPACGASDIDVDNSFFWIDDPGHAYPFLAFQETAGYVQGFTFDMAQPHPYGGLPSRLADGPHVVHAELVDYAGNFDFRQWSFDVDTGVLPPVVAPLDATWVGDARPTWTMQFREDVEPIVVKVDGVSLTGGYQVYPKHATQNPDGTRLAIRPPVDLPDGHVARVEVTVRDRAGNQPAPYASTLKVDRAGPAFAQATPAPEALLPDGRPTLSLQVRDDQSGLALGGVRLLLDGQAASGTRFEADRVVLQPATQLASGRHDVRVEARDLAGNIAATTWSFVIDTQAPSIAVRATVPDGQTAAKRGDAVRLEALVPGGGVTVTFDARSLDPAAKAVAGKADGAGRYVASVNVTEARTGELQILAQAIDAAGHKGTAQAFVTVDNRPPVAFMHELPVKVAHSFLLSWAQDGESDATHYILEVQVDGGAWTVADPDVRNTTYHWDPVSAPATLRFRVSAIDGAGNRQSAPSNVAETQLVPSPVDTLLVPNPWPLNGTVTISMTPVATARLRLVHAELTLPDGSRVQRDLQATGTMFRAAWNVTAQAGTGRLDLVMEDEAGATVRASYPVSFQQGRPALAPSDVDTDGNAVTRGAPGPAVALLSAALAATAYVRRRRQ